MPRPERVFVAGGVYHVYNRIGRGERVFDGAEEAASFVELFRRVVNRDGLTVYAWCLMSNHYHLAVRTGEITLDRSMRSLQQGVTRGVNVRRKVFGPLWQGRYRTKLVEDQRYLDQLLIYIHLNPVSAGLVDDPADYPWSGHGEILGRVRNPIVDVDEVLRVFGATRRSARSAYVRGLKGAAEAEWIGEAPGRLPWWRLGRPPRGEDEDPEEAVRQRRRREVEGPDWRPRLSAEGVAGLAQARPEREVDGLRPPAGTDEPPRAQRASNPHADVEGRWSIRELVRKGGLAHGENLRDAVVAVGVAGRTQSDRRGRWAAYNRPQSPPGRRARSARATPTLGSMVG